MRPRRETRREEEGVQDRFSVQHVQEEELSRERRWEPQKVNKGRGLLGGPRGECFEKEQNGSLCPRLLRGQREQDGPAAGSSTSKCLQACRTEEGVREALRKRSCEPGCLRERLRGDWGAPAPAPGRLSLWMGWELAFGGVW